MTYCVKSTSWILSLSLSVGVTLTLAPAICDAEPDKNTALLTIDAVEDLIHTHNIQSVEEFLPLLPETYLSHYALVFNSRSLQSSTFANPRVLMYGNNAKLVMSFNGSPDQKGYDALELFEFNELTKTFQLEEIQFPAQDDKSTGVHFSQKNPERCIRCHSTNPHPLWDAPPLWPGSYGEAYHEKLSGNESSGLYAFLHAQPTHPRYRYLKNTALYQDDATFYPNHHNIYNGVEIEAPNAQLSRLFTTLNNEKIMQQVMSNPRFDQYRYALLASLSSNCNALPNYFPAEWRVLIEADYAAFSTQDDVNLERQQYRKMQRSVGAKSTAGSVSKDNSLRDFRYIAERGLAINTAEWSMALERNAPDFTALEPIKLLLEKKLIAHINAEDRNIMKEYYYRNYPENNRYCAYLEKKSKGRLADLALQQVFASTEHAATQFTQNLGAGQILFICASCHTTGIAPRI